ncbi:uncharacterized protein LOC123399457 [Hordeum vulgare subsp. vulgare]|uniref:Uncharacterized protein n=1 Tax=Hordeum vulgare subsp. vulgare TaxID=112509 RepID=A0A8I6YNP1_HORVV|nr:uncharacterized protein LOC123399457 [Hordeum vulgare subsp. vulgare]KAI4986494.1 hypothetical protein ZWY2020_019124 [Hordeum vulgare]
MASTEELPSFRTPGAVPFKWELQPGIPKKPAGHGAAATAPPSLAPLQLPPRLALPPGASARAASTGGARWTCPASTSARWTFAGVSSAALLSPPPTATTTAPRHRRSMSARFATSLTMPFTRRRGRSREDTDVAFAALYGDSIVQ